MRVRTWAQFISSRSHDLEHGLKFKLWHVVFMCLESQKAVPSTQRAHAALQVGGLCIVLFVLLDGCCLYQHVHLVIFVLCTSSRWVLDIWNLFQIYGDFKEVKQALINSLTGTRLHTLQTSPWFDPSTVRSPKHHQEWTLNTKLGTASEYFQLKKFLNFNLKIKIS